MRARIVDGPNQLVTSLGCASHFDRNLLASIINLRRTPFILRQSPELSPRLVSPRVSSRVPSRLAPLSPTISSPRRDSAFSAYEEKRRYLQAVLPGLEFDLFKNPSVIRTTTPASNNPRDDSQTLQMPRALSLFIDTLNGPRSRRLLALTTIDGPQTCHANVASPSSRIYSSRTQKLYHIPRRRIHK